MSLAVYGFVSRERRIEPAGISYEFSIIKDKLILGLSTHPILKIQQQIDGQPITNEEDEDSLITDWIDEENIKYKKYIAKLDPNHAKEQDHYKVLGLSKLRYKATQAQIKAAYRQKVLRYHPDKGKVQEGELRTESVFACIQKAYEQLGLSEDKRRAFDSVDPTFNEDMPDSIDAKNFFEVLEPIFERNSRFSVNQPVPLLGTENSNRTEVEHFYDFWFDWKSWREFSYMDAEDKTRGEDRWERREIEKQNKVEREKRRKKYLKRISSLVELAYSNDPRVARFKEEDRRHKEYQKEQRRQQKCREKELERENQKRQQQLFDMEQKKQEMELKKATEARQEQKKLLNTQRRRLRKIASTSNYWVDKNSTEITIEMSKQQQQRILVVMEQIERICLSANFEELSIICEKLSPTHGYEDALKMLKEYKQKTENTGTSNGVASQQQKSSNTNIWSASELQLLVKAFNLYPPGTQLRWKQVAEYVSYHGGNSRNEKDIIKQVKCLKATTPDTINSNSPQPSENAAKNINFDKKLNADFDAIKLKNNDPTRNEKTPLVDDEESWSVEQQRQLENALKQTTTTDPKRWDHIAAMVDGKTRKQCIQRYKRIAELIKQGKTTKT